MRSEASFAALCGTSPVEASSGNTTRHRLNRGANNALWRIAMVRLRCDERTIAYAARRRGEGRCPFSWLGDAGTAIIAHIIF